ncbi:MAG: hypothetical protein HQK65_07195, partial [Desulfamplus sp.]|nr:hypothetical protein [Desulfamplus sp.]
MQTDHTVRYALIGICLILAIMTGFPTAALSDNITSDPQMTGLPELSEADIQWQNKHMLKVKKVKINKLALQRINESRSAQGKVPVSQRDVEIADTGQEIEGTVGDNPVMSKNLPGMEESAYYEFPAADLPGYIDNSSMKYFPPIRSQGSLNSCGVFNGTYYAMTYMYAFANDLDAKNGGDAYRLSPKWTYNMVNSGGNNGTW